MVFFLVLAAGAYAMIATTHAPEVTLGTPDQELSENDTVTVEGRTYTVAEIEATQSSGGGHGGGGGIERTATFEWTDESASFSEEWTAGETAVENATVVADDGAVTVDFPEPRTRNFTFEEESVNTSTRGDSDDSVRITFENGSTQEFQVEEGAFVAGTSLAASNSTVVVEYHPADVRTWDVLVEDDSTVLLREQPTAETIDRDGRLHVLVDRDGDGTDEAVPIEEYDGIERARFTSDDDLTYRGNETSVAVDNESITLEWTATAVKQVEADHETNVTLNGQRYFAFFPDNDTVQLKRSDDLGEYRASVDASNEYHERENGFWGVVFVSMIAAVLLIVLAYLPRKEV